MRAFASRLAIGLGLFAATFVAVLLVGFLGVGLFLALSLAVAGAWTAGDVLLDLWRSVRANSGHWL